MMSVSDFFYGGQEPVWIVHTPSSTQKFNSNNPQTPQYNPQTPQCNQQAMQYSPVQAIPYNVQAPQSVNRHVNADALLYKFAKVVELKGPACCESCQDRIKHCLFNGVESVNCDTYTQRVVVTGNVEPADILRICRKLHKRSELLQKKGPKNVNVTASPTW